MSKTLIVSVFTGCGKTWISKHSDQFGYTMRDSDSSSYEKIKGWEKQYVADVLKQAQSGQYDFVFVCQTEVVLDEMDRQKVPYVIVEPNNIIWNKEEPKEYAVQRQLIKQQWFGRIVLWDNSHIADFEQWFEHIKEIYDERTSLEFLSRHNQIAFFTLNQNQYLSDIINDLYWKKEHNSLYVVPCDAGA